MATNNAHLPDDLLVALTAAAQAEGKTTAEILAEAVQRYLAHKELDGLVERGRSYAERLGRKPSDVARLIRESRTGEHGR